jgi:N-formylglutamate amidohydrolase
VAVALHDGHEAREDVAEHFAIPEAERLREEDPWTAEWTRIAPTRIVVHRSRFEVDLNRPIEECVYLRPDQAWNLQVWKNGGPPAPVIREGREIHLAFYSMLEALLREVEAKHGRFVVYDLHSYNHRRGGPHSPPDDRSDNPDVNLGTGSMDRSRWAPVVDAFLRTLRGSELLGRLLDVRENARFRGGYLAQWMHRTFPHTGCALAVEVKKFFMDEWTGDVEPSHLESVRTALARTVPAVEEALERL